MVGRGVEGRKLDDIRKILFDWCCYSPEVRGERNENVSTVSSINVGLFQESINIVAVLCT